MKKELLSFLSLKIMLASVLLLQGAGCKKKSGNDGPPAIAHSCRVSEHVDSTWGGSSFVTDLQKYTYQYDDKGNATSRTNSENTKYADGSSFSVAVNTIWQYDGDGFIIQQIDELNRKERNNSTTGQNSTTQFQYDQARMTRLLKVISSPSTSTQTIDYAYDSKGELIKETDSSDKVFLLSIIYDYTGGILYKITSTDATGTVNIPYIELNSQGLFTKTIDGTIETRYQYDALGQLVRKENWVNGMAVSAISWEYDDHKNEAGLEFPAPKGYPRLHYLSYAFSYPIHNPVKANNFLADPSGQWAGNGYDRYTYQYNTKGYPLTALLESFDAKGNKLPSSTKSTYSYTNCE